MFNTSALSKVEVCVHVPTHVCNAHACIRLSDIHLMVKCVTDF